MTDHDQKIKKNKTRTEGEKMKCEKIMDEFNKKRRGGLLFGYPKGSILPTGTVLRKDEYCEVGLQV